MRLLAARSLGTSPSDMRPISPYLKVPLLAHSTTSPMACFLAVATRRAAVRNSLRSWFNPELPLPLLGPVSETDPLTDGLTGPFAPIKPQPFSGDRDFSDAFGTFGTEVVLAAEPTAPFSRAAEPITDAG